MKKFIVSFTIGAVFGYTVRKCQEKRFFEKMYRNVSFLGLRIKNELRKKENTLNHREENIIEDTDINNKKVEDIDDDVLNEISY